MKIDFLIMENLYGSTAHFAHSLSQSLEALHIHTQLHYLVESRFSLILEEIYKNPPTCTCSFSDITLNGKPLSKLWKIPHLSFLLDPAIYSLHQLEGWLSCIDAKDEEFLHSLGFSDTFYFPHAADRRYLTLREERERPLECVFFGSCIDYKKIEERWHTMYDRATCDLLHAASARVLALGSCSILEALIELKVKEELWALLHSEIDLYTRGKDRVELLRSLSSHAVHIWGEGPWESYLPQATIHKAVAFGETLKLMQSAQVVVNSSPRFKRGLHERIVYGWLSGAFVLAADPLFPGVPTYEYGNWRDMPLRDLEGYVVEGQRCVLENHTWDHRAQTLLLELKKKGFL